MAFCWFSHVAVQLLDARCITRHNRDLIISTVSHCHCQITLTYRFDHSFCTVTIFVNFCFSIFGFLKIFICYNVSIFSKVIVVQGVCFLS